MKVSNYSFLFSTENYEFYIYNTLSNALIEIDNDTYNILLKARQNKSEVSEQMLDSDLYNTLCQKKFITNNEQDDFLLYKSIVLKQRADKYHIHMLHSHSTVLFLHLPASNRFLRHKIPA